MDIKVKIIKENKDGSANAMVDFDAEGLEFLVQEGLLSLIQQYIAENKNAQEGIKLRKKLAKKPVAKKPVAKKVIKKK
jgi:hypothetical protein